MPIPESGKGKFLSHFPMGTVLSTLLTYPLLFFAHKYGIPWSGMSDFSSYHDMVLKPLDFGAVRAPFAMRQLTTLIAHGIFKLGIVFDKHIWFLDHATLYGKVFSPDVFFAMLIANAIGVALAGAIIYAVAASVDPQAKTLPVSPWGGAALGLLLLSGGTLFYVVAPLTEGWTWLIATSIMVLWRRESRWVWAIIPLLFLCIFQRELLPLAFLVLAMSERIGCRPLSPARQRFLNWVIASCCLSLVLYAALRGWILPTRQTDIHQISPLGWYGRFMRELPALLDPVMIRSAFFKHNLPLLWALFIGWSIVRRRLGRDEILAAAGLAGAAVSLFCVAYANGAGRGVDRFVVMLSPLFVLSIIDVTTRLSGRTSQPPELNKG